MQLFAHFGKLDRLRIILRGKGCRELPVQERIQGCYAHQSEAATSPAAHSAVNGQLNSNLTTTVMSCRSTVPGTVCEQKSFALIVACSFPIFISNRSSFTRK